MVPAQKTFMLARTIYLREVGLLHVTIHEVHSKKMDGVLFKIDFKKMYDINHTI
jgi:hypothetical protein